MSGVYVNRCFRCNSHFASYDGLCKRCRGAGTRPWTERIGCIVVVLIIWGLLFIALNAVAHHPLTFPWS